MAVLSKLDAGRACQQLTLAIIDVNAQPGRERRESARACDVN